MVHGGRKGHGARRVIKYIGSKRKLIPHILQVVDALPDVRSACDVFTGTTRVAQALKASGRLVVANDLATYSWILAEAFIATDAATAPIAELAERIAELNALPGCRSYFTQTYAEQARFFHPTNAMRIDAIREQIAAWALPPGQEAVLLTALLIAADRVDSTTGVQMAYLKSWAPRALRPMTLALPRLLPGPGVACRQDARTFLEQGGSANVDLTYVDPPYNQHSYLGNYHIWETLVCNDRPETYGIARKRIDVRQRKSPYNSARRFHDEFAALLRAIESPYIIVSFSNEGFANANEIRAILAERRAVHTVSIAHQRYIGAQIGIYNPAGERVGTPTHDKNTEYLFVAGPADALVGLPGRLTSPPDTQ